jgi:hypothetical protein
MYSIGMNQMNQNIRKNNYNQPINHNRPELISIPDRSARQQQGKNYFPYSGHFDRVGHTNNSSGRSFSYRASAPPTQTVSYDSPPYQELPRQELSRQELSRQELSRQELSRQELSRQEFPRQEFPRQESTNTIQNNLGRILQNASYGQQPSNLPQSNIRSATPHQLQTYPPNNPTHNMHQPSVRYHNPQPNYVEEETYENSDYVDSSYPTQNMVGSSNTESYIDELNEQIRLLESELSRTKIQVVELNTVVSKQSSTIIEQEKRMLKLENSKIDTINLLGECEKRILKLENSKENTINIIEEQDKRILKLEYMMTENIVDTEEVIDK